MTQNKTKPDIARKVVFLTKSGHPPTAKSMNEYLSLFAAAAGLKHGQTMEQQAVGGPIWNEQPNLLADLIERNPDIVRIAVLDDKSQCQLIRPDLLSVFADAIRHSPSETSWCIAMNLLNQT
ncbi:hypothetical protein FWF89_01465 [Candidatus Saccharibacteria bacterium]|nr:hypothetical protein [Candidatus Saccharibacteria bacterium]